MPPKTPWHRPLPGSRLLANDERGRWPASRRRLCIDHVRQTLSVSERRVCRTLGQHRSTQRKVPCGLPDEERLTEDIIVLTKEFGRYALPGRLLRSKRREGLSYDHGHAE
jgi:hypothetical protein